MSPFIHLKQTTPLILIVILLACFASPDMAQADEGLFTQQRSFAALLAGHRWEIRSGGLGCQGLIAVFQIGGTFNGILQNPPDDMIIRPQRVRGKWGVESSFLILSYNYIDSLTGGPPATARFMIQITEVSERSLSGVQQVRMVYPFGGGEADETRLWRFERLD
jgi:hypothetical protein